MLIIFAKKLHFRCLTDLIYACGVITCVLFSILLRLCWKLDQSAFISESFVKVIFCEMDGFFHIQCIISLKHWSNWGNSINVYVNTIYRSRLLSRTKWKTNCVQRVYHGVCLYPFPEKFSNIKRKYLSFVLIIFWVKGY